MNLKPLGDHVIVKPAKEAEMTKSGIIIPDTAKEEKPEQGEVLAIGPGKVKDNGERLPMTVKVGDTVVFKKYSPDEVKIGDEEYLVVSESDIIAIVA
jgi:chaperonin GroES